MAITLKALGLTRLFGPNKAVNNVSFELSKGEVLGFLGPNALVIHHDADAHW